MEQSTEVLLIYVGKHSPKFRHLINLQGTEMEEIRGGISRPTPNPLKTFYFKHKLETTTEKR